MDLRSIDLLSDNELIDEVFRRFDEVVLFVRRSENEENEFDEYSDFKGDEIVCLGLCENAKYMINTYITDEAEEDD